MKKQILVLNVHSFVDVITNSSTELFICDGQKSVKVVEAALKEMGLSHCCNVYIYTQEKFRERDSNREYRWRYERKGNIGKIIIEGTGDNDIPYERFDEIEKTFNASGEHLG